MTATRTRAWRALSERLRELVAPDAVSRFVGGTHTRRFADNILPGLSQAQIAVVHRQLSLGSGSELKATSSGKRPAHAPYSSAALAANTFGRWIGSDHHLCIGSLSGFALPLTIEERIKIKHGAVTANLDCYLHASDGIVGVESKLTETLAVHKPVPVKSPDVV